MDVLVNGEMKELRMLGRNGIDEASDLATNYPSEAVDEESGLKIMSQEEYDWFVDTFAQMERVEEVLGSNAFTTLSEDLRNEFWEITDMDMDICADRQLEWLYQQGLIPTAEAVFTTDSGKGYFCEINRADITDVVGVNAAIIPQEILKGTEYEGQLWAIAEEDIHGKVEPEGIINAYHIVNDTWPDVDEGVYLADLCDAGVHGVY